MCGIAGIFHYAEPDRPIDVGLLERMTRMVRHRGPDGEGFHVERSIGLGHRRLSIVDLSPTGAQPMSNEDGSCWMTYNGEFYNHAEYRPRLEARGHRFRGTSDTETLLHLLEEDGPACLEGLAGIFAFAYWDARRRELLLVRDPLGVKQLYYFDDGKRLLFASEMKALLECEDVRREMDPEAVNQYLHFHTALFDRTFFRHIRQLRQGEYVRVSARGLTRQTYWRVEDFSLRGGTPEANIGELRSQLERVVGQQLMADVPVGSFFSGGIDSTAAAAFASQVGKPPLCFGVHFTGQGVVDERPYQEAAAKALGLELLLTTLDGSTFPEELMKLHFYQDAPIIGPALFPMYHVSRLASQHVKVCLGGQGADEIFGGYARYALTQPLRVLSGWVRHRGRRSSGGKGPGTVSTGIVSGNLWKQLVDWRIIRRLFGAFRHLGDWRNRYFANFAKVPERLWRSVFAAEGCVSRAHAWGVFNDTISRSPAKTPADQAMHWDVQTYLTGLFHQDDRMSMANSLESRVPLADPRLVRFAFRSGFDLKFRAGSSKWLLRQAVADRIPEFVLNRRKIGFDTPAETWMKTTHAPFVRDLLLSTRARERGIWNTKGLQAILEQPSHPYWFDIIWKAVCIEAWACVFLDGNRPAL